MFVRKEVLIIVDKKGVITINYKGDIRNLAVDGLILGLVSGLVMVLVMALLTLLSGNPVVDLLESFSIERPTLPLQGLLSHLSVSAIYGLLFGVLIWPILNHLSSPRWIGWLSGLGYGLLLLLLAQVAILPGLNSPLVRLPFWEWALGHLVYGLVLGGSFTRKMS